MQWIYVGSSLLTYLHAETSYGSLMLKPHVEALYRSLIALSQGVGSVQ